MRAGGGKKKVRKNEVVVKEEKTGECGMKRVCWRLPLPTAVSVQ